MANSSLHLVALSITKTKNPAIFMVSTSKGMFSVKKTMLNKRGIVIPETGAYFFPEPTVVIIDEHKEGEYVYGVDKDGKPIPAPQQSSRLDEQGNPVYEAGATPKWSEDGATVRTFVAFSAFEAQLKLEKLMAQVG